MKKLKKAYFYLFYKLYKWIGEDNWLADLKAVLSVEALIFLFWLAMVVYYTTFIDPFFRIGERMLIVAIFLICISAPNYFIFHHRGQWKDIVKEFDQFPKRTNKIGGWIVFGVVMLVITNMVFAFYQMSLVDWSQYR